MKVIHFFNELKYSGAEIMYVNAAPIFQMLGCELAVVNTTHHLGEYAMAFEKAGYKVYHWPYPKSYLKRWQYYRKVITFLKQEHYAVVHIHSALLKWGISYCAWQAKCKSVYTFHSVFHSHWYSYFYHWWLRWSAKHLLDCKFQTISDSVYENEKTYYHNETVKIYNWYGSGRFYPADINEKENMRKKLSLPNDALVIISVGGCSPIKRHTDVIRALSEILKVHSNTFYLHLGEGISLNEEKETARQLGVDKHIVFCGNQKDVREFLIASDIYVMTSQYEGISITTIEAMACKIPSVLYEVPGLRDFNKDRECSELIAENHQMLAKAILNLYKDKNKQKLLIENAKELVDSHFNMETNVNRIFELYMK